MNVIKKYILILFVLVGVIPSSGASAQGDEPKFSRLLLSKNIGNLSAKSICQDKMGTVWFCTNTGLFSYNGIEMVHHTVLPELFGLGTLRIRALNYDESTHCLYFLVRQKPVCYDIAAEKGTLLSDRTFSFLSKGKEALWLIDSSGLYRLIKDKMDLIHAFSSDIKPITLYAEDDVPYVSTERSGVFRLTRENEMLAVLPGFRSVSTIYKDSKAAVWLCSEKQGLARITDQDTTFFDVGAGSIPQRPNSVRDIIEDEDGRYWLISNNGIMHFNEINGTVEYYGGSDNVGSGVTALSFWSLIRDKQGSIWFGSYAGDIYLYNKNNSIYRSLITSDLCTGSDLLMSEIVKDNQDRLWISTEWNGLYSYDLVSGKISNYKSSSTNLRTLSSNNLTGLYYDEEKDRLWVGCHSGGICFMDLKTQQITRIGGDALSRSIMDCRSISKVDGGIIFSTLQGIQRYDYETNMIALLDSSINLTYLAQFAIDGQNRLWINNGNALICYDLLTKRIKHHPFLIDNVSFSVYANRVFCDHSDNVWITTQGGGVVWFDSDIESYEIFNTQNSDLLGDITYAISELNDGFYLISTNNGLNLFDQSKNHFWSFSLENGFRLSNMVPGGILIDGGDIYVSGKEGLFSVDRSALLSNDEPFRIWLSSLKVNGSVVGVNDPSGILRQVISQSKEIRLAHDQNILEFAFGTDNYMKINNIVYEYMLEGFDAEWNRASSDHRITYMNLPADRYRLLVRGYSANFPQNQSSIELNVVVRPHPLQSSVAYVVYLLILVVALWMARRIVKARIILNNSLYLARHEKEQIEVANQSKLRFFTNISHEFRTPVTLILGQLQMLLQSNIIPPTLYQRILSIHRNALKMQELITELIDFRKQEQGFLTMKVSREPLAHFVEEVFLSFNDYASQNRIYYLFHNMVGDLAVWIDAVQFRKVIYNLIFNAFKYSDPEGNIEVIVDKSDTHFVLKVKDSGVGIPSDLIEKIFDRFYQVDNQVHLNAQSIGSGIGLALSKGVVEAHGGEIRVESELGEGSLFVIEIPLELNKMSIKGQVKPIDKVSEDVQAVQQVSQTDWKTYKKELSQIKDRVNNSTSILIVEDHEELRTMLQSVFAPFATVYIADNGLLGVEMAASYRPHLIISDVMMPYQSGMELCKRIKEDDELCHIPVVLLTSCSSPEENVEGLKCGADDYIVKPFHLPVLITRCMNLILSRQQLREKFGKEIEARPRTVTSNSADQQFLEYAINVVEKNIDNKSFQIPDLAKALLVSPRSLAYKIKALTNQTPLEFVMTVKLRKGACLLLEFPDEKIASIADQIGFSDAKYFANVFKQQFGITPSQHRKDNGAVPRSSS